MNQSLRKDTACSQLSAREIAFEWTNFFLFFDWLRMCCEIMKTRGGVTIATNFDGRKVDSGHFVLPDLL